MRETNGCVWGPTVRQRALQRSSLPEKIVSLLALSTLSIRMLLSKLEQLSQLKRQLQKEQKVIFPPPK
jgi:hypothetical protein